MQCDSKTSYVSRVQVYTGRQPGAARETNQGQRVVQELCRNLAGSGRNVICDNFFTSLSLIQELKKNKMTEEACDDKEACDDSRVQCD